MENWIWIALAIALFWLMFRHGGCCGGHAKHGERKGSAEERPRAGSAEGRTHEHTSPAENEEGLSKRPSGVCH